jgi:flagellar hook-basal body complex protein FliE
MARRVPSVSVADLGQEGHDLLDALVDASQAVGVAVTVRSRVGAAYRLFS